MRLCTTGLNCFVSMNHLLSILYLPYDYRCERIQGIVSRGLNRNLKILNLK